MGDPVSISLLSIRQVELRVPHSFVPIIEAAKAFLLLRLAGHNDGPVLLSEFIVCVAALVNDSEKVDMWPLLLASSKSDEANFLRNCPEHSPFSEDYLKRENQLFQLLAGAAPGIFSVGSEPPSLADKTPVIVQQGFTDNAEGYDRAFAVQLISGHVTIVREIQGPPNVPDHYFAVWVRKSVEGVSWFNGVPACFLNSELPRFVALCWLQRLSEEIQLAVNILVTNLPNAPVKLDNIGKLRTSIVSWLTKFDAELTKKPVAVTVSKRGQNFNLGLSFEVYTSVQLKGQPICPRNPNETDLVDCPCDCCSYSRQALKRYLGSLILNDSTVYVYWQVWEAAADVTTHGKVLVPAEAVCGNVVRPAQLNGFWRLADLHTLRVEVEFRGPHTVVLFERDNVKNAIVCVKMCQARAALALPLINEANGQNRKLLWSTMDDICNLKAQYLPSCLTANPVKLELVVQGSSVVWTLRNWMITLSEKVPDCDSYFMLSCNLGENEDELWLPLKSMDAEEAMSLLQWKDATIDGPRPRFFTTSAAHESLKKEVEGTICKRTATLGVVKLTILEFSPSRRECLEFLRVVASSNVDMSAYRVEGVLISSEKHQHILLPNDLTMPPYIVSRIIYRLHHHLSCEVLECQGTANSVVRKLIENDSLDYFIKKTHVAFIRRECLSKSGYCEVHGSELDSVFEQLSEGEQWATCIEAFTKGALELPADDCELEINRIVFSRHTNTTSNVTNTTSNVTNTTSTVRPQAQPLAKWLKSQHETCVTANVGTTTYEIPFKSALTDIAKTKPKVLFRTYEGQIVKGTAWTQYLVRKSKPLPFYVTSSGRIGSPQPIPRDIPPVAAPMRAYSKVAARWRELIRLLPCNKPADVVDAVLESHDHKDEILKVFRTNANQLVNMNGNHWYSRIVSYVERDVRCCEKGLQVTLCACVAEMMGHHFKDIPVARLKEGVGLLSTTDRTPQGDASRSEYITHLVRALDGKLVVLLRDKTIDEDDAQDLATALDVLWKSHADVVVSKDPTLFEQLWNACVADDAPWGLPVKKWLHVILKHRFWDAHHAFIHDCPPITTDQLVGVLRRTSVGEVPYFGIQNVFIDFVASAIASIGMKARDLSELAIACPQVVWYLPPGTIAQIQIPTTGLGGASVNVLTMFAHEIRPEWWWQMFVSLTVDDQIKVLIGSTNSNKATSTFYTTHFGFENLAPILRSAIENCFGGIVDFYISKVTDQISSEDVALLSTLLEVRSDKTLNVLTLLPNCEPSNGSGSQYTFTRVFYQRIAAGVVGGMQLSNQWAKLIGQSTQEPMAHCADKLAWLTALHMYESSGVVLDLPSQLILWLADTSEDAWKSNQKRGHVLSQLMLSYRMLRIANDDVEALNNIILRFASTSLKGGTDAQKICLPREVHQSGQIIQCITSVIPAFSDCAVRRISEDAAKFGDITVLHAQVVEFLHFDENLAQPTGMVFTLCRTFEHYHSVLKLLMEFVPKRSNLFAKFAKAAGAGAAVPKFVFLARIVENECKALSAERRIYSDAKNRSRSRTPVPTASKHDGTPSINRRFPVHSKLQQMFLTTFAHFEGTMKSLAHMYQAAKVPPNAKAAKIPNTKKWPASWIKSKAGILEQFPGYKLDGLLCCVRSLRVEIANDFFLPIIVQDSRNAEDKLDALLGYFYGVRCLLAHGSMSESTKELLESSGSLKFIRGAFSRQPSIVAYFVEAHVFVLRDGTSWKPADSMVPFLAQFCTAVITYFDAASATWLK